MVTSKDFRLQARRALTGKWKKWILLFTLAAAFGEAFGLNIPLNYLFSQARQISFEEFGVLYYTVPAGFGWALAVVVIGCALASSICVVGRYRAARAAIDDEDISARTLFPWSLLGKCVVMNVARFVMIWLWSLLLLFPGIIAAYRYSMADDLLARDPELGPIEALRESRLRMHGFKLGLFSLDISFILWVLLIELAGMGVDELLQLTGVQSTGVLIAINAAYSVAMWFATAALALYRFTARALFFTQVDKVRANPHFEGAQTQGNPYAQTQGNPYAQYAQQPEPEAEAEDREQKAAESAADEAAAERIYRMHRCSRIAMRQAGVLEKYESLNPASYREEILRRDYGNELMRRFSTDPDALDDLLSLASEYSMDSLTDRMLERVERHIREGSAAPEAVLNMAGRTLAMLTSGAFATDPGFVSRKKAQILNMAARMEEKLQISDPGGDWKKTVELIRKLCQ